MKIQLPEKVQMIIQKLEEAGYESYAVGGCVRDSLLGRSPMDWDITTSALPYQVKELFPRTVDTGIAHGTVTVLLAKEGFEVTTYRIDGEYEDARHPKNVTFTRELREDLRRRDFTINAMAYNDSQGLVDLYGGQKDLSSRVIRCVGCATERFTEDALRMLRAIRFGAQLDFSIEEETFEAIRDLHESLGKISAERIQTELTKLLTSSHPERMRQLYETGLSGVFLPEFDAMMTCPQNTKYHCYSVGEHTIKAVELIEPKTYLRLAMLFHDIGKPVCKTTDQAGIDHFKGHPVCGAQMVTGILRRLRFDNETIRKVTNLVRWHDEKPNLTEADVRLAMHQAGLECYPDLFSVMKADLGAKSDYHRKQREIYLMQYEALVREIWERGDCLSLQDLAVGGKDLLEWGLERGPQIGDQLEELLLWVLEDPDRNEREQLFAQWKRMNR